MTTLEILERFNPNYHMDIAIENDSDFICFKLLLDGAIPGIDPNDFIGYKFRPNYILSSVSYHTLREILQDPNLDLDINHEKVELMDLISQVDCANRNHYKCGFTLEYKKVKLDKVFPSGKTLADYLIFFIFDMDMLESDLSLYDSLLPIVNHKNRNRIVLKVITDEYVPLLSYIPFLNYKVPIRELLPNSTKVKYELSEEFLKECRLKADNFLNY